MLKTLHQGTMLLDIALSCGIARKPLAKGNIEGFTLGLGYLTSPFDEILVCAKSYIFHVISVHDFRVHANRGYLWELTPITDSRRPESAASLR